MGERKPLVTDKSKNCTLPISVIIIHTSLNDRGDQRFLEHWEDVTGTDIDDYLRNVTSVGLTGNPLVGRLPESFFENSARRSFFVPAVQSLHKGTLASYMALINQHLVPANVGGLLWILHEFFLHLSGTQQSVSFDVGSGSETSSSVFRSIAQFCRLPKYQDHPHLRTLLALAHLPKIGIPERCLAVNVVVLALHTLATYAERNKSMVIKYNGQKYTQSH